MEHYVMSSKVDWYYDQEHDTALDVTTTRTYMLLYCGHLNNLVQIPLIPAPKNLPEFLRPLLATLGHEGIHKVEPILEPAPLLEYIPLSDLQPMSLDLPP